MLQQSVEPATPQVVMEWVLVAGIRDLHEIVARTGLLSVVGAPEGATLDDLADAGGFDRRATRVVLDALTAVAITDELDGRYTLAEPALPQRYVELADDVAALRAAIEDGFFDTAERGNYASGDCPPALVRFGLVDDRDGEATLTAAGRRFFAPSSSTYLGSYVVHASNLLAEVFAGLATSLRTGTPSVVPARTPGFFARLSENLFPLNVEAAAELASRLLDAHEISTVIDVGSGSGVWSIALAEASHALRVEALDFSPVLELTRNFAHRFGVGSRFTYTPADALRVDSYGGPADLTILGYLCCGLDEQECRTVLARCADALRPGGVLVIADFLPDADRREPLLDVLFSLVMVGVTERGETHTADEYSAWCHEAGFIDVEVIVLERSRTPVLVARKSGASSAQQAPRAGASASPPADGPPVPPGLVVDTTFAFAQSCMLLAAVELELFTWISRGDDTLAALASRVGAPLDPVARLVGGLAALGFLRIGPDEHLVLTPVSERYLVLDRPTYVGDVARQIRAEWDAWIGLTDIVRTGLPARVVSEPPKAGPFFQDLVSHLFPLIHPGMTQLLGRLGVGTTWRGARVLDLGCGLAPGAIAALELDPDAQGVGVDMPEVIERARARAEACGVLDRLDLMARNVHELTLPPAEFDLVIASHLFRIVGPATTRRLLEQSHRALRPGGRLVILELYNDGERAWRLMSHITAVNMLVNTRDGTAYGAQQMIAWLRDAGFSGIEVVNDFGPDPVLVATRPIGGSGSADVEPSWR